MIIIGLLNACVITQVELNRECVFKCICKRRRRQIQCQTNARDSIPSLSISAMAKPPSSVGASIMLLEEGESGAGLVLS